MYSTRQKEQFSLAFVHAVASVGGYAVWKCFVDEDSVDMGVCGTRKEGTVQRAPHLEIQAKCTERDSDDPDALPFELKLKNYDDLRDPSVHLPRILVVVVVPLNLEDWLEETPKQMAMRKCAYWMSLRGLPEAGTETGKTVRLPKAQRFTVAALRDIMMRIGEGNLP
jgi:hypothetical protein